MFSRNLRYFRLKAGLKKKELAAMVDLTPMAITHYENGSRTPDSIEIINRLSEALRVRVIDFLNPFNDSLVIEHGKDRTNSRLTSSERQLIEMECENFLSRLFEAAEFLGGPIFAQPPDLHSLQVNPNSPEQIADDLRKVLGFSQRGPVPGLVSQLENAGFLICPLNIENEQFSSLNGTVNGRPFLAFNRNFSPVKRRFCIIRELIHMMFNWSDTDEKEKELLTEAAAGAFLMPKADLVREIGIKRKEIGPDMRLVAQKYRVSPELLVRRAKECQIISVTLRRSIKNRQSLQNPEFYPSDPEDSHLLERLVLRAFSEHLIERSKAAELLEISLPDFNRISDWHWGLQNR